MNLREKERPFLAVSFSGADELRVAARSVGLNQEASLLKLPNNVEKFPMNERATLNPSVDIYSIQ